MKGIIIFIIAFAAAVGAQAQENASEKAVSAPFGLEWGMLRQEIIAKGVTLASQGMHEWQKVYKTKAVPKNLSDADFYYLGFDGNDRLVKAVYFGKTITGDLYGIEGKQKYGRLKDKLTARYGSGQSFEYMGRKLYDESDEFYQCLAYDGCGSWNTYWGGKENGLIALSLNHANRRGRGYIRLGYESALFYKRAEEWDSRADSKDDEAL